MKSASLFLCLVPTIAIAIDTQQVPPAVAPPTESLSNIIPSIPLDPARHQLVQVANPAPVQPENPVATYVPDQWPAPSPGSIGLGDLSASPGSTKSLRARSEGTLGQTPWIGMAIGLTCTALAAVMLG
ncbi:hypothetical protein FE257_001632 [Aspergillus nanangensis]|uniref:Uncharacterized protein n=1 Tax=Aspergillus nanangensis TaxID=2582783 RepID=A0AAD4CU74_ASPNN|nr:hypothetical protein FE257_001632 [Aspergillus nanangensis]